MAKKDAPPRWDRRMQQRLARGEAGALGELYDRFASLVHGLGHRVLGDERCDVGRRGRFSDRDAGSCLVQQARSRRAEGVTWTQC